MAQPLQTYIGDISSHAVILAWGTTNGSGNTIGRDSKSHGKAVVRLDGKDWATDKNWIEIPTLAADRDYDYQVTVKGAPAGMGSFRTWPETANKLAFLVIGDYGNGSSEQAAMAGAMRAQIMRRSRTDNPVRFVLTTGDNIYGEGFKPFLWETGSEDKHWASRFFNPYRDIISHVPFYPSLGNHDGSESERTSDLAVYMDNFFFPGGKPARYYRFSFAGLADFFALDTTENKGTPPPGYGPTSPQTNWLKDQMAASNAKWKIPYFHHPPFTAGPEHEPSLDKLRHWVDLFREQKVQVVFTGHEHNFQYSAKSDVTGNVQYFVTGSAGKLRTEDIAQQAQSRGIAGWAVQRHFLLVEIADETMRVTPLAPEPVTVSTPGGQPAAMPVVIKQVIM